MTNIKQVHLKYEEEILPDLDMLSENLSLI